MVFRFALALVSAARIVLMMGDAVFGGVPIISPAARVGVATAASAEVCLTVDASDAEGFYDGFGFVRS